MEPITVQYCPNRRVALSVKSNNMQHDDLNVQQIVEPITIQDDDLNVEQIVEPITI
jgi:uncharacterized membrane protein affecting hemolysin expression